MGISAATGERVKELMSRVRRLSKSLPLRDTVHELLAQEEERVSFEDSDDGNFEVQRTNLCFLKIYYCRQILTDERFPNQFRVTGVRIEKGIHTISYHYISNE